MVNVGQLAREERGDEADEHDVFGSYRGSVIAGARWGAPMQRMTVPPARGVRRTSCTPRARGTGC